MTKRNTGGKFPIYDLPNEIKNSSGNLNRTAVELLNTYEDQTYGLIDFLVQKIIENPSTQIMHVQLQTLGKTTLVDGKLG